MQLVLVTLGTIKDISIWKMSQDVELPFIGEIFLKIT